MKNPNRQNGQKKKSIGKLIGWAILIVAVLALLILVIFTPKDTADMTLTSSNQDETPEAPVEDPETQEPTPDQDQTFFADITVENYGTITVQLDAEEAPLTVANFVSLAQSGFYDGLTFHRIMDGFMMQGGDPTVTGSGDSGTNIKGEFVANGWENNISHTRGVISMARATDYNSASCQFFIVQSDSTFLDGQYAGFGRVTEGLEYVDAICADAQPTDNNGSIPADQQPVITSIVIRTA